MAKEKPTARSELDEARRSLKALKADLLTLLESDSEQEVQGIALGVIEKTLQQAKGLLGEEHPVASSGLDLVSADAIEDSHPLRAADLLIVVGQLEAALPPRSSAAFSP